MNNIIVATLSLLLLVTAACRTPESAISTPCPTDTAVLLTLTDENKVVLDGVQVSYRVNGGEWQEYPERVNGRVTLSGGVGTYEIRAEKTGYEPAETVVPLAALAENSCETEAVTAVLTLPFAQCPTTPRPLLIRLPANSSPVPLASAPDGSFRSLTCRQTSDEVCQEYALPLEQGDEGNFSLAVMNLPETGTMQVIDGLVSYNYEPYELELTQGMRQKFINAAGVQGVLIELPVERDEVGCPLVDLTAVTYTSEPGPYANTVSIDQTGDLLITDVAADECQQPPVLTNITYEVTLPEGTRLDEVEVIYWRDEDWVTAECRLENNQYLCTAQLPNPLLNQFYSTRARINGVEYIGTQLPFTNLCLFFDE
jgi:hypothetical protein